MVRGDGQLWGVREIPCKLAGCRDATCLVFENSESIRQVRNFPPDWRDWSEAELYALSLGF